MAVICECGKVDFNRECNGFYCKMCELNDDGKEGVKCRDYKRNRAKDLRKKIFNRY